MLESMRSYFHLSPSGMRNAIEDLLSQTASEVVLGQTLSPTRRVVARDV